MPINIDESTGLPSLPDGYFWRVVAPRGGYPSYHVQIRKKTLIGSKINNWQPISRSRVTKERILQAALYLINNEFTPVNYTNNQKFIGDYPPKNLNANNQDA